MSVITNKQKVQNVKNFIDQGELVLCIGKNDAWDYPYSDSAPQPELATITSIDDAIAYKSLGSGAHIDTTTGSTIAYARPDVNGSILYNSVKYAITTDYSTALNSTDGLYIFLYIKGTLIRDEIPTGVSYRKLGIFRDFNGIFDINGVALPEDVTDPGVLMLVDYRKPTYRDLDQSEIIELIIPV